MGTTIDFSVGDVETTAYVAVPDGPGPFPGVVVAFHKDGLDPFTLWLVDDLARNGYAAIAPNFYHVLPPGMDLERRREFLTDDQMALDLKAAADWLTAQDTVDSDRLALLGHCMGGRTTWMGLVSWPEIWKCGCVWYGGNAFGQMGTVPPPADRLSALACPVAGFFGNNDGNPSPDDVAKISAMLTDLGKQHDFNQYDGANHGFMGRASGKFHEGAARDSWTKALQFLSRHIGGNAPEVAELFPAD